MSKKKLCTCSRNRKCREHLAAEKAASRIAEAIHKQQRVDVGIDELRAKYAREGRS